jgi:hypothetical protein
MAMWTWDDPPEYIAKWKPGADGEHQTEKALKHLVATGSQRLKGQLEQETKLKVWVQAVVVVLGEFIQVPAEQGKLIYLRGDELRAWWGRPTELAVGTRSTTH